MCRYAECNYAECRYAEYQYAEYHYAEYHYAECRGVQKTADFESVCLTVLVTVRDTPAKKLEGSL